LRKTLDTTLKNAATGIGEFFYNDDRYLSSEAGTGGKGCRGGQNEAAYFVHAMLF
jgi:hypothetical protein